MRLTKLVFCGAMIALLAGCFQPPTPEERAADRLLGLQISGEISEKLPVLVDQCINQIETGQYSEARLLAAGYTRVTSLFTDYQVAVSEPVQITRVVTRPHHMWVNIGPSAASLTKSGCKINFPERSDILPATVGALASAFGDRGYPFSMVIRGRYEATKGDALIRMEIVRVTGGGSEIYLRIL